MKQFLKDETGAVSVDFMVLASVAAAMGLIVTTAVRTGAQATGTGLQENFTQQRIQTNLHPPITGSQSQAQVDICGNGGSWQQQLTNQLGSLYSGNIQDLRLSYAGNADSENSNAPDKQIMRKFRYSAEYLHYRPDSLTTNNATSDEKDAYVEAMFAMCELGSRNIGADFGDYVTTDHNNTLPFNDSF